MSSNDEKGLRYLGLGGLYAQASDNPFFPSAPNPLLGLGGSQASTLICNALAIDPVKRRAFFSFHFDDIMRVNVVRNAWRITYPDTHSFTDSSLWESRQLEGEEALKGLIRDGVKQTSAVCVLIGSETWLRQWVRYEIARAIIDGRGLLGVHLNSIKHHKTLTPHTRGTNPLEMLAVGKMQTGFLSIPVYDLFEKVAVRTATGSYIWEWHRYSKYSNSVDLPPWLRDCQPGYVTPLSECAPVYDYIADDGHRNIGTWIDQAAQRVGR